MTYRPIYRLNNPWKDRQNDRHRPFRHMSRIGIGRSYVWLGSVDPCWSWSFTYNHFRCVRYLFINFLYFSPKYSDTTVKIRNVMKQLMTLMHNEKLPLTPIGSNSTQKLKCLENGPQYIWNFFNIFHCFWL